MVHATAATPGGGPVRHPAARLALGLLIFVLIAWGVGELWISLAGSTDLEAVRSVARERSPGLTTAAKATTWAGSAVTLVPLALVCCVALVRVGLRREALAVAVSLAGAILIYDVTKLLVSRPRPPLERLQLVHGSSFPSGHAAQAGAFWCSLVLALGAAGAPRLAAGLFAAIALVLVLAVAGSRVYLGVHYPADVVAGVLLGAGWAAFVSRSLRDPEVR